MNNGDHGFSQQFSLPIIGFTRLRRPPGNTAHRTPSQCCLDPLLKLRIAQRKVDIGCPTNFIDQCFIHMCTEQRPVGFAPLTLGPTQASEFLVRRDQGTGFAQSIGMIARQR